MYCLHFVRYLKSLHFHAIYLNKIAPTVIHHLLPRNKMLFLFQILLIYIQSKIYKIYIDSVKHLRCYKICIINNLLFFLSKMQHFNVDLDKIISRIKQGLNHIKHLKYMVYNVHTISCSVIIFL